MIFSTLYRRRYVHLFAHFCAFYIFVQVAVPQFSNSRTEILQTTSSGGQSDASLSTANFWLSADIEIHSNLKSGRSEKTFQRADVSVLPVSGKHHTNFVTRHFLPGSFHLSYPYTAYTQDNPRSPPSGK